MTKLTIKGELCGLNEYIAAHSRNRYVGGKIKKDETERVYWACKEQKLKPVEAYPVHIQFVWWSKNNKKDIDNVAFAKKFILDGLQMAGVLINDGRKQVNSFEDLFPISKDNPRCEITITKL